MRKYLAVLSLTLILCLCACGSNNNSTIGSNPETSMIFSEVPRDEEEKSIEIIGKDEITELFDHVLDIGTYTELDYSKAEKAMSIYFDRWGGMCSAAAVKADNGNMLIGRNFDLVISDRPVYVYKTKIKDSYETLCLTYNHLYGSSCSNVMNGGLSGEAYGVIPFMASDVLNSEGLYIEMNMRYDEPDESGKSKFGCSGTNPSSEKRVCALAVPQLVGQNCANVDEALEYIRSLNIYSMNGSGINWNLCFLLADASGKYGVLEMADNEISWLEKQQVQTNFYITEQFYDKQLFKSGVGRYDHLMDKVSDVNNDTALFALMNDVRYSLIYYPEKSLYDVRTEYVGETIGKFEAITYEQIIDEANKDTVTAYIKDCQEEIAGLDREQMGKSGDIWESTFTLVANCNEKTIKIRFFENDEFTTVLSF